MLSPKRIAIIGGAGQMGRWFSKFFVGQGCSVVISGRRWSQCLKARRDLGVDAKRDHRDAIKGADLIIISVMADRVGTVAREIGPYVQDGQTVIDITSVKELPVRMMHRYIKHGTVLGVHPMFGPSAEAAGQNMILTPTNGKEARLSSALGHYLRKRGFRTLVMSPRKHDEMIGAVLSLTHFIGFVTADSWKLLRVQRFSGSSSTSFRFLMSFVSSIVESSPELYAYLQVSVPSAYGADRLFMLRAKEWGGLVRSGNKAELIRRMSGLRRYMKSLH